MGLISPGGHGCSSLRVLCELSLVLVHAGGGAGRPGMLWTLVFRSRPRRFVEKAARSRSADRTVAVRSPALQRTHGLANQVYNQYCTKPLNSSAPSYTNKPGDCEFRSPGSHSPTYHRLHIPHIHGMLRIGPKSREQRHR